MQEAADLAAALAAVRAVSPRAQTASDEELLADGEVVETIGRIVDGLRNRFAAEVEFRSRKTLGEESLAFRSGARDGVELVRQVARIDHAAAKRRVGLGTATAPAAGLDGRPLPGRLPQVRAAVESGRIGVESARIIANTVKELRLRVAAESLDELTDTLVTVASKEDAETLHDVAVLWAEALDPDGPEPEDRTRRRKRAAKLGRTLADGTTTLSVVLLPEHLALIRELFQSRRRDGDLDRVDAGASDSGDDLGPEWRPVDGRTQHQQDYDTLLDAVALASRVEHDGSAGTAVTHEVVVHVTAADLLARAGAGWTAGVLAGLAIPAVEQVACSGGTRLLVTGADGEPLHLSRRQRIFSAAQKKALTARAGGRCQFPGCRTPAPYLEAHHAAWWERDGGPTDIGNGVMLCSYHHHLLHARSAPVRIVTGADGRHSFVPAGQRGHPRPEQAARTGPWTPAPGFSAADPWHPRRP